MALNYSVFNPRRSQNGSMVPAHNGPPVDSKALATSTDSAAIPGPCELVLLPDEDQRVKITKGSAPGSDPAATDMKLIAKVARSFDLGPGTWYVRWVAAA